MASQSSFLSFLVARILGYTSTSNLNFFFDLVLEFMVILPFSFLNAGTYILTRNEVPTYEGFTELNLHFQVYSATRDCVGAQA